MRSWRSALVVSMVSLTLLMLAIPIHASAQVACGATISTDTTLTASDPVVFDPKSPTDKPCPSSGLIVKSGVTLDCAGLTIKGKGVGTGISAITGDSAVIMNCVVDSFSVGVSLGGRGSHTVDNVRSMNNKTNGVALAGGQNSLSRVVSANNAGVGFMIRGDANQIGQSNVAIGNTKGGFSFSGNGQFVDTNYAVNNGAAGFFGTGRGSSFTANTAVGNKGAGMTYSGGTAALPNDVGNTAAIANGGDGIVVAGTATTVFDDGGNFGEANAGATQCKIGGVACQ